MAMYEICIGDSNRGYTTATVKKAKTGRYTLVPGSVRGLVYLARSAVRGLNDGDAIGPASAVTRGGDHIPVRIKPVLEACS